MVPHGVATPEASDPLPRWFAIRLFLSSPTRWLIISAACTALNDATSNSTKFAWSSMHGSENWKSAKLDQFVRGLSEPAEVPTA